MNQTTETWIISQWSHGERTHETTLAGYVVRITESRNLRVDRFRLHIVMEDRYTDTLSEAKRRARLLVGLI